MLKFFRKYNTIILVIGGAFLMVSFLLMDTIGRLGSQLGLSADYAEVEGKKVTAGEFRESINDLRFVQQIAPEVLAVMGVSGSDLADHWYLLIYEAEKAGFIGGPGDGGTEFIETGANLIADAEARRYAQFAFQFGASAASIIEGQRNLAYNRYSQRLTANRDRLLQQGQPAIIVDTALAKLRGIIRMLESQPDAGMISRPEALAFATDLFDTAQVRIGVIPASFRDIQVAPATDGEIAQHFETYKDQRPADNDLGIGYLLEPAVKAETIGIERQSIIDALTVDEIEVNKFWRINKARFGDDWVSAKPLATSAYKEKIATKVLDRATRIVQRETLRTTRNLPADGNYKTLPSDWSEQRVSFDFLTGLLMTELAKEFEFTMPKPVFYRATGSWQTRDRLASAVGIGKASWRMNENTNIPYADLLLNARSLDGSETLSVQTGIVVGPLAAPSGVYFARITETRNEGAPETIGVGLRDQIAADIRAIEVFEDLKDRKSVV